MVLKGKNIKYYQSPEVSYKSRINKKFIVLFLKFVLWQLIVLDIVGMQKKLQKNGMGL